MGKESPGSGTDAPTTHSLVVQKRKIKAQMLEWELNYESMHEGLVPTHADKRESPEYSSLKAQARQIESALILSKTETKAQRATEEAEGWVRQWWLSPLLPLASSCASCTGAQARAR